MAVYTYDPSKVTLTVCGYRIAGWVNISIQLDEVPFKTVKGLGGNNARIYNKDTAASISLTVLQTGVANYVLSEIHRLDAGKGTGRLEIVLKDLSGETTFSSDNAYVEGYPVIDFSAEAGSRVWKINCLNTRDINVGSNYKPALDLF